MKSVVAKYIQPIVSCTNVQGITMIPNNSADIGNNKAAIRIIIGKILIRENKQSPVRSQH